MAHVWTYWECKSCGTFIRGDHRDCPNCGAPIPNGVKYLMPDNPIVLKAKADGKLITNGPTSTDSKGIIAEVVSKEQERNRPNWNCPACGYQNFAEDTTCRGCGMGKESAAGDYFGNKAEMDEANRKNYKDRTGLDYEDESKDEPEFNPDSTKGFVVHDYRSVSQKEKQPVEAPKSQYEDLRSYKDLTLREKLNKKAKSIISSFDILDVRHNILTTLGIFAAIAAIIFLIWLFIPIERTATISGVSWYRALDVQEYTECHENDWSLPSGATLEYTREEIHHYDHVLDHYETKTRTVSEQVLDHYETHTRTYTEQVFDGYDTSYRDLGNGQADVVQTPRYRTETRTETYQEPVYRTEYHQEEYQEPVYVDVPVYQTKYYYEIGRWQYSYDIEVRGDDQNPYWPETDIPEVLDNPVYGDLRISPIRHEEYSVIIIDYKGNPQNVFYSFDEWNERFIGEEITYKTFRFSDTPLPF